jgi:hypothetical protein
LDGGGVHGDDDADDGEGLSAVRAAVLPAAGGDVVRERSGDGEDAGDDVRDDVIVDGIVAVALAPCGFAALDVAVALA